MFLGPNTKEITLRDNSPLRRMAKRFLAAAANDLRSNVTLDTREGDLRVFSSNNSFYNKFHLWIKDETSIYRIRSIIFLCLQ